MKRLQYVGSELFRGYQNVLIASIQYIASILRRIVEHRDCFGVHGCCALEGSCAAIATVAKARLSAPYRSRIQRYRIGYSKGPWIQQSFSMRNRPDRLDASCLAFPDGGYLLARRRPSGIDDSMDDRHARGQHLVRCFFVVTRSAAFWSNRRRSCHRDRCIYIKFLPTFPTDT